MRTEGFTSELTCDDVREMAGAFVLGALEPDEDVAVRAHLAGCNDAHAEIAELASVLPALAQSVPLVEPPAGLKARIMAAAAAEYAAADARAADEAGRSLAGRGRADTDRRGVMAAEPAQAVKPGRGASSRPAALSRPRPPQPVSFPTASERAARRSTAGAGSWLLRIAAVVAIAALGGWGLILNGQLDTARSQLDASRAFERNVAVVLDAASDPGALTAVLSADGGTGTGLAAVRADGSVAIAMRDLAPTSGDSVYETWVIGSDGVPVAIGGFRVDSTGTGYFEASGVTPSSGIVLALTLEPGPGATVPTAPVISKGVATAAS